MKNLEHTLICDPP